jgi:uncharacterized membrane protein
MEVPKKLRGEVSEATLDTIASTVDEAESKTSGEIVVRLVHRLLPLEKPRARAQREFFELRCHETKLRNGVLLFVVMASRRFEIVADEGIDRQVEPGTWEAIADRLSEGIARHGLEHGVCDAVASIGEVLAKHFPREAGDVDELPDRPTVA